MDTKTLAEELYKRLIEHPEEFDEVGKLLFNHLRNLDLKKRRGHLPKWTPSHLKSFFEQLNTYGKE